MQQTFNHDACVGDPIRWQRSGLALQARIEYDLERRRQDHGHAPDDQAQGGATHAVCAAWQNGDWLYCGIVVTTSYHDGRVAPHAAGWGRSSAIGRKATTAA